MNVKIISCLFILSLLIWSCQMEPQGPSDSELENMTRFEKWESLERGMSDSTVFRILGKPSARKSWAGQTTYTFECFGCTATFNEKDKLWSWFAPQEGL